jgi:hypothetical protein
MERMHEVDHGEISERSFEEEIIINKKEIRNCMKRKYKFYYKYHPYTMTHYVDAPKKLADYMEREWKKLGLKFTRVE